jgi:hypothetical protein
MEDAEEDLILPPLPPIQVIVQNGTGHVWSSDGTYVRCTVKRITWLF